VFGQLPGPVAALHELVDVWGSIDHVGDPGVPARLDLGGVVLVLLVVDPACPDYMEKRP
jgi:hypothetical protein